MKFHKFGMTHVLLLRTPVQKEIQCVWPTHAQEICVNINWVAARLLRLSAGQLFCEAELKEPDTPNITQRPALYDD